MQLIEKARENLPAKQPAKKKAGSAAPSKPVAVAQIDSDQDEPRAAPAKKEKSPNAEPPEKGPKGPGKTKAKGVWHKQLLICLASLNSTSNDDMACVVS